MKKPLLILVAALAVGGGAVGLAAAFLGDSSERPEPAAASDEISVTTGAGGALPRVTFTSSQIAAVGLTEEQAREAGYEVKSSVLPLDAVPRAIVNGADARPGQAGRRR